MVLKLDKVLEPQIFAIYQDWLRYMHVERAMSEHTVTAYSYSVEQFFLAQRPNKITRRELVNLTLQDFRTFLAKQKEKGLAVVSTNRHLAALKHFFNFSRKYHQLTNNALGLLKTAKRPKNLPKSLEAAEIELILQTKSINAPATWVAYRNHALLLLLYSTGLRISEALAINLQALQGDRLIVLGKRRKERLVPLLPIVQQALQKYLTHCPYKLTASMPIFRGSRLGQPLQAGTFALELRKIKRTYNLPEHATAHALRHSFASHLLQAGCDLRSIQELLGHANLSSTQIYTQIDTQRMLNNYQKNHPCQDE